MFYLNPTHVFTKIELLNHICNNTLGITTGKAYPLYNPEHIHEWVLSRNKNELEVLLPNTPLIFPASVVAHHCENVQNQFQVVSRSKFFLSHLSKQ